MPTTTTNNITSSSIKQPPRVPSSVANTATTTLTNHQSNSDHHHYSPNSKQSIVGIIGIAVLYLFQINFIFVLWLTCASASHNTQIAASLRNFLTAQQNPMEHNQHLRAFNHRPEKLLRGCPRELLQIQGFRQFPLVCRAQPALAVVAYEGILDAMDECRNQMRFERWDCSQPATVLHQPTITRHAYRESAYLWAMSAAGVAWGIATACAQGWLEECKCVQQQQQQKAGEVESGRKAAPSMQADSNGGDGILMMRTISDWDWGGCSYGVQYGVVSSRKLLTRIGSGGSNGAMLMMSGHLLRKLEKHNLKVGRMAVKRTLTSSCRCHGVSGSCQQKTCWKKAADLSAIAKHLAEKYRRAKMVSLLPGGEVNARNTDLVYLERSVDLCSQFHYDVHQKRSLPRICSWRNATHTEGDCTDLCCGLGYLVSHEVVPYKCECKFVWCCRLECRECLEHRWISTCNT